MKDNTMVLLPDGELAIRIFIFGNGDGAYLLGNGHIIRLGLTFPKAKHFRGNF